MLSSLQKTCPLIIPDDAGTTREATTGPTPRQRRVSRRSALPECVEGALQKVVLIGSSCDLLQKTVSGEQAPGRSPTWRRSSVG